MNTKKYDPMSVIEQLVELAQVARPKITWASTQPYKVVIRAVAMEGPRSPPPLDTSMAASMLIRPTSVPTMPKAGATAEPLSA